MSLVALVIVILLLGLLAGLAQRSPWIAEPWKTIAFWVCIVATVVLLLQAFGVLDLLLGVQVPRFGRG